MRIRKIARVFVIALVAFVSVPSVALSGNGTAKFTPAPLIINVTNPDPNMVYLDILVPKKLPEVHYGKVNEDIRRQYPQLVESSLATLDSDGYVSYSMYFNSAYSELTSRRNRQERYFAPGQIHQIQTLKIVTLDDKGNVLHISNDVSIQPDLFHLSSLVTVQYDESKNTCLVDFEQTGIGYSVFITVILLILEIPSALVLLMIKILAALIFKIKPIKSVVIINIIILPLMTIGAPLLTGLLPFLYGFALLSLTGLVTELIVMIKKQNVKLQAFTYVLIVNLVTIAACLCLFSYVIPLFRIIS